MKKKLRIGILFGGRSGEHEVSLLSAASILHAIDRKKYEVVPIGIGKQGQWLLGGDAHRLLNPPPPASLHAAAEEDAEFAAAAAVLCIGEPLNLPPLPPPPHDHEGLQIGASAELAPPHNPLGESLDVIFPVLHGTFGEDGTIQGLFELADLAYVGSNVLASAASMDKDVMKRLCRDRGLPVVEYIVAGRDQIEAGEVRCE